MHTTTLEIEKKVWNMDHSLDLNQPFPISRNEIDLFQKQGFIKLKQVLSPATLKYFGHLISQEVKRLSMDSKPMSERTTYEKAFLQVMNLWTFNEEIREFCFGKKFARMAAELMQVKGVRLYHDQALYKEPSGGFTPWHADKYYWPVEGEEMCTAWIPLQATPLEMGPLAFSAGSHRFAYGRDLEISDQSEATLQKALEDRKFPHVVEAFDLGEVSFHSGWTFHHAGPNLTNNARAVMTMIYMRDGSRLTEPTNENQRNDWNTWMPGTEIGKPVQTHLNPVLYQAGEPGSR